MKNSAKRQKLTPKQREMYDYILKFGEQELLTGHQRRTAFIILGKLGEDIIDIYSNELELEFITFKEEYHGF